jgi:hypothetical protein
LFIDWATAGGALAGGTTEEFALHLAVLTDHERGAPTSHAKHEAQGAKVAIFDPELILPQQFPLIALSPLPLMSIT